MSAWRHALAIVLLPGTVVVVVPTLILMIGAGPELGWGLAQRMWSPRSSGWR